MSTSLEGFGGVSPPLMTHTPPLPYVNQHAPVSLVARGMLRMVVIESARGSYSNESLVSTSVEPFQALPPAV